MQVETSVKSYASVQVKQVMIPTYGVGLPDRNPMFLEKRVYQGSSGKVYPLPVIDRILDEKHDQPYTAVILENEYISVMALRELGQTEAAAGRFHKLISYGEKHYG